MLYHVMRDDGTEAWEPLQSQEVPIIVPGASAVWKDVSDGVMFGFNGLRRWPDLGSGAEFEARACVQGKLVHLSLYGKVGAGAIFPSTSAWFFYMLSPELQANGRRVGSAAFYLEGGGSLGGFCRFLNKADATPPYWPLCLYHAPLLPAGAGYITSTYPWPWAQRPGSWFTASITYEAA